MKLLLTFTYNVSLDVWYKSGVISREISLYKKLSEKNVKTIILTYGDHKDYNYVDLLNGIQIIPIKTYIKSKNRIMVFLKTFLIPLKLKKVIRNVNIIKTNQIEGSWIAVIAKILYRKKIIIRGGYDWLRNYIALNRINKKKNYFRYLITYFKIFILEYFSLLLADRIILTSDSDINFVIKAFKLRRKIGKFSHFYNFVDENLFKPMNLIKKDKHVLFIGKLYSVKNLIGLLNAFKDLDDFVLDIIGEGKLEEDLNMIIKELGIKANFLGIIPNEELPEIINQYQIFILPSFYEGNPKVLLEAMSCGISCIGTNVRGINNIIKHKENGYLCETDSISIRNAIISLYNDKKLRKIIGQEAREFIVNNCSLESIANKEYLLYKSLFI